MLVEEALAVAAAIIQAVIAAKANGSTTINVADLVSKANADATSIKDGEAADDAAAKSAIAAAFPGGKP